VRLDVVSDHASDDKALFQTVLAQGVSLHLGASLRLPPPKAVPIARFVRVFHRKIPMLIFATGIVGAARTGRKALWAGGGLQGDAMAERVFTPPRKARSGGLGAGNVSIAPQFRLGQNGLKIE